MDFYHEAKLLSLISTIDTKTDLLSDDNNAIEGIY